MAGGHPRIYIIYIYIHGFFVYYVYVNGKESVHGNNRVSSTLLASMFSIMIGCKKLRGFMLPSYEFVW